MIHDIILGLVWFGLCLFLCLYSFYIGSIFLSLFFGVFAALIVVINIWDIVLKLRRRKKEHAARNTESD